MGKTLLVVGAHADDNELGAALTSVLALNSGYSVINLCLSEEGKRAKKDLPGEWKLASERMGYTESVMLDFPDCFFYTRLKDIIVAIEGIAEKYSPEIAITHSQHDTHQDHRTASEAARVALRGIPTLLFMEGPSTDIGSFRPVEYQTTEDIFIAYKKAWALEAYASQSDIAFPQAAISHLVSNGRYIQSKQNTASLDKILEVHGETVKALSEWNPFGYLGISRQQLEQVYLGHLLMHPPGTLFAEKFDAARIQLGLGR